MASIVWLASYPKSGNTWLRALLTNYRSDSDAPADINHLDGGPIASARLWFDEWTGVEASALGDAVIERLRPDVYRCLAREATETLFMKVHDAWGRTDACEPLFPRDVTAGVVYVMRNPLDLAASCAHHWGVGIDEAVERLCDPTFVDRRPKRLGEQLPQRLGPWTDHVRSWVDESALPVHVVRYEDMHRDPERAFAEVVRFCDLPVAEERVRTAVALSTFEGLRDQEAVAGFRERSPFAPGPFFRRGRAGAWRKELPPGLARRMIDAHGAMMRRFGYTDSVDEGRRD